MLRLTDIIKVVVKNKLKSVYFSGYANIRINKHFGVQKRRFTMFKKLRKIVLNEMNKTILFDETGSFVGLINNERIVEKMSLLQIIKHIFRIFWRYRHA